MPERILISKRCGNHRRIVCGMLALLLVGLAADCSAQRTPTFQAPVLITSAGQCADVTLAGSLCRKAGIEAKVIAAATAADLKGFRTLMIVAGFSSKGLGAAGTSREQEMARVKDIIAAAQKAKLPILTLHIGGKARRGAQSDDFNRIATEAGRYVIVVKQGNEDGLFTAIAADRKIPIDVVEKIAGVIPPLTAAFK